MSDVNIVFDYADVPTVQRFSESDKFVRSIVGPFGSGKSSGCVIETIERGKLQVPDQVGVRKTRWAVVRNTYPQLRDTTIKTYMDWIPEKYFGNYKITDHDYFINKIALPDGTRCEIQIMFRALDKPEHVSNLLSLELTGAWINEIREIPKAIFDAIQGRVGRYPPQRDGGCTWKGVIADTNPCDEDHWFYKLFEEEVPKSDILREKFEVFHQPSGLSPEAENLRNLPPNYYTDLAVGKDPNFIKVYIHGQYGYVRDGKPVYNNWTEFLHLAKSPLEPIKGIPLILGFDFGLTPACVIIQLTPKGKLLVLRELYAEGMGMRRFLQEIVRPFILTHFRGFPLCVTGDPAGKRRSDTDERHGFLELNGAFGASFPARSNVFQVRFNAVDGYLTRLLEGEPAFQVDPSCKMLIKGFNGEYRMRRLQKAFEAYSEEPEKNAYSHPHDALQYAAMATEGDLYMRMAERQFLASHVTPTKKVSTKAWT